MKSYHWCFAVFGVIMISLLSKSDSWWGNPDSLEGLINIHPTWAVLAFGLGCYLYFTEKDK